MPEHVVRIAHISDLHFTSEMSWPPPAGTNAPWASAFQELRRDLKAQRPHLIVVTGDIANNNLWELRDHGLERAWGVARAYLEDLAAAVAGFSKGTERLFVVPGNHDVKLLGNVSRDELGRIVSSPFFRCGRWFIRRALRKLTRQFAPSLGADIDVLTDPNVRHAIETLPTEHEAFDHFFEPYTKSRFVPELDLYVLCVNSNVPNDPMTSFAQGAVSADEALRLANIMDEWRAADTKFDGRYKLALLHHHPMPIPLSEGMGGIMERDQFHLMRNAGNFMKFCLDNGVDFVLHGHKHAQGYAAVSIPTSAKSIGKHSVCVVGAGSVHVPFSDTCSYNVLTRKLDRSWEVDSRSRPYRSEGIAGYTSTGRLLLASPEQYREREWHCSPFSITARRMEILVVVDPRGDLRLNFAARQVRPSVSSEEEEIKVLKTVFSAESRRATIEDVSFVDENPSPNALRGVIKLDPPATRTVPRDVEWSFTGVGMVTFSQDYAQWYKNDIVENFSFGIGKQYEILNVEVEFPEDFPPRKPRVEVWKIVNLDAANENKTIKQLMKEGVLEHDASESEYCRDKLRMWAGNTRLSLHVNLPLPQRYYRIVWELPTDEFEILPDGPSVGKLRSLTRAAVKRFREILTTRYGSHERERVRQFLEAVGADLVAAGGADATIRVDLAVHQQGGPVRVVGAVVRQPDNGTWADVPFQLECELGETLRGRAYLERRIVFFGPGDVENERNPPRHEHDDGVSHQIGIPLLWPPEPPFYPRLGVLTISGFDGTNCGQLFENLTGKSEILDLVLQVGHEHVQILARDLQCPLPDFEIAT